MVILKNDRDYLFCCIPFFLSLLAKLSFHNKLEKRPTQVRVTGTVGGKSLARRSRKIRFNSLTTANISQFWIPLVL
jgi:hypothetical protein